MCLQGHIDKLCARKSQRLFLVPGLVTSENPAAWKQGGKGDGRSGSLADMHSLNPWIQGGRHKSQHGAVRGSFQGVSGGSVSLVTLECRLDLVTCF